MRLPNWTKHRVLLPWNNLGCLGFASADGKLYGDLFLGGTFGLRRTLRAFLHDEVVGARRWYTLTWNGWELDKVEPTNPFAFTRVCRRTMQPYKEVTVTFSELPDGFTPGCRLECISYPFLEDGRAQVMLRELDGVGVDLMQVDCDEVRPIDWARCTGIPANDPLDCLERSAS
jgi:hypothetical protein